MTATPSVELATTLPTATLHEAAGRIGALPARLRPAYDGARLAGPAFPVTCPSGDNLWLHHAVYEADPGDVLVVATADAAEYGYWGELLSEAAIAQRLGGLVIDGGVRDTVQLAEVGFPVFSSLICIRGTVKDPSSAGSFGDPVTFGEVRISRGDLVVGDADGVVAIPADRVDSVTAASIAREEKESGVIDALRSGRTTLDLYDMPALER